MAKTKILGLDKFLKDIKSEVSEYWVNVQNERLVAYAKKKIRLIGDAIQLYNSKNHMDRTGNLLDSLCWVVSYNGKMVEGGFYREQQATEDAYLHELLPEDYKGTFPVYGHRLAEIFITQYGNKSESGQWVVYFAVLAPYWAYWEKGHENILTKKFEHFAVMAEVHDMCAQDLKPAKVELKLKVPHSFSVKKTDRRHKNDVERLKKRYHDFSDNSKNDARRRRTWPSMIKDNG